MLVSTHDDLEMIHLLVVDDQKVFRMGLAQVTEGTEFSICEEAGSIQEGLSKFETSQYDLVVIDARLPDGDGLALAKRLKERVPSQRVLILSEQLSPSFMAMAIGAGVNGYIHKGESQSDILKGLRRAASGENLWTNSQCKQANNASQTPQLVADVEVSFTSREQSVFKLLVDGQTNREIATTLDITYETTKEHIRNIFRKIGVSDRTQAAVWAVRKNIFQEANVVTAAL